MTYRKSYYEQRMEEQARIKQAISDLLTQQVNQPVEPVEDIRPDESWNKASIQAWLDEHDIAWSQSMTKKQLLELVDEKS